MADIWDWWRKALAGEKVERHFDRPEQGFFALSVRDKPPIPAAIWYKDGFVFGKKGQEMVDDVPALWASCLMNPISHQVYTDVMGGAAWPTEIRIVRPDGSEDSTMIGNNSANEELQTLDDVREWSRRADAALAAGDPKTKDEADSLSDLGTKLRELVGKGDKIRLATTLPLRDEVAEINKRFNRILEPGDVKGKQCLAAVGRWQKAEKKKLDDEAAKLRELAKSAGISEDAVAAPAPIKTGTRRAVSTVPRRVLVITDFGAAMAALAARTDAPDGFRDELRKWAERVRQDGGTVPGTDYQTVESTR